MLERHIAFYGNTPRQAAADGGFAMRDNLATAKAWGVHDMAFHKKAGLRIKDMVKGNWVYRKLTEQGESRYCLAQTFNPHRLGRFCDRSHPVNQGINT
ncbi:hypothetical protein ATN84_24865 [Paramesorhizobium deserti]|uniref:Transposase DDE domain-containing protein n=1 Tax=Paramesorhizobium deserti TaxID=1494590 RepID=A0A135HXM8_9HYPH|nr:hypothetical protein ATN84_24865 [Paramesorhizobium deserti]